MKYIFIVAGGEDINDKPRSKKLISEVMKLKAKFLKTSDDLGEFWKSVFIIPTGRDNFNLRRNYIESEIMRDYYVKNGIPEDRIFCEKESLDTVGNIIFSVPIVLNIMSEIGDERTNIVLITENFHSARLERLVRVLMKPILIAYRGTKVIVKPANSRGINWFKPWEKNASKIVKAVKSGNEEVCDNALKIVFGNVKTVGTDYVRDVVILSLIEIDSRVCRLETFGDYQNYLFLMPGYEKLYKSEFDGTKREWVLSKSIYRRAMLLGEQISEEDLPHYYK